MKPCARLKGTPLYSFLPCPTVIGPGMRYVVFNFSDGMNPRRRFCAALSMN
jgi:hypothetical protein